MTKAYPGEQFSLGIQVLDEINRPTSDIIRITDLSDNVRNLILSSGLKLPFIPSFVHAAGVGIYVQAISYYPG